MQGKTSDIDFKKIEEFVKSLGAYSLLKSTSQLSVQETEVKIEVENMDKLEEEIIAKYASQEKSNFEPFILPLVNSLSIEKQEDETSTTFNSRLFSEINKLLEVEI